jgi:large subunit ribosomal protein L25
MEALELEAQIREETGKGHASKLRRKGLLPCVLYGSEIDSIPLTVKTSDLDRVLREGGPNALIKLKVDSKEYVILIKEVQTSPVGREYLHADLQRISLKEKLDAMVPLHIVGESEAPGIQGGGVLQHLLREVQVRCLPTDIPESIEVDVSQLDFGESITVGDLKTGDDVEILTDPEEVIVSIVAAQAEEEPAEVEGEGEAEAGSAEPAEPARGGEEGEE